MQPAVTGTAQEQEDGDRTKGSEVTLRSLALASRGESHEVQGDERQPTSPREAPGSPDKHIARLHCPLRADCTEPWLPPRPHIANLCDVASQCFPSRGLFLYPLNLGWPCDQDWARVKTNKMSRAQNLGRR